MIFAFARNKACMLSLLLAAGVWGPAPSARALDASDVLMASFVVGVGYIFYLGFQQHGRDEAELEAWIHCILDLLDEADDEALRNQESNYHDDKEFYVDFLSHLAAVSSTDDAQYNPSLARYPYTPFLNRLSHEYYHIGTDVCYSHINDDFIRLGQVFDAIIARLFNASDQPVSNAECAQLYHYATRCFDSLRGYHPSMLLKDRLLTWEDRRTRVLHWYTPQELYALQEQRVRAITERAAQIGV